MNELEWTAVVLPNDLDAGHGDMHAQIAIDRRRHEVILKSDVYDPLAVWNFVNGPLSADYDARVFDIRESHAVYLSRRDALPSPILRSRERRGFVDAWKPTR
jgi:hypothetical protein